MSALCRSIHFYEMYQSRRSIVFFVIVNLRTIAIGVFGTYRALRAYRSLGTGVRKRSYFQVIYSIIANVSTSTHGAVRFGDTCTRILWELESWAPSLCFGAVTVFIYKLYCLNSFVVFLFLDLS